MSKPQCAVGNCTRTPLGKVRGNSWLCGEHWRSVPKTLRKNYMRTLSPVTWKACVRVAQKITRT